VEAFL